jgi:hypothetical protein
MILERRAIAELVEMANNLVRYTTWNVYHVCGAHEPLVNKCCSFAEARELEKFWRDAGYEAWTEEPK